MRLLQIIEPTLCDETGHCYSYMTSLLEANREVGLTLELWIAHEIQVAFDPSIVLHCYFLRRFRRLQQFWLYVRLLLKRLPFFVPTAGQIDLMTLRALAKCGLSVNNVFLHFHQFRKTKRKLKRLRCMRALHENVHILVPTKQLYAIFQKSGFKRISVIPCFSFQRLSGYFPSRALAQNNLFHKLLFAGAARSDKGFPAVVDFIAYLAQEGKRIPFECQVSPPHSGRYDVQSRESLVKLSNIRVSWLTLYKQSLSRQEYLALFEGAICLLPYDPNAYADKFSAVLLDALLAGCPVIVPEDTWMSETVRRFKAGIIIRDNTPQTLLAAAETLIDNYGIYSDKAYSASKTLRIEHDPKKTLEYIKQSAILAKETKFGSR